MQQSSLEPFQEKTGPSTKSSSTTSYDVSKELNPLSPPSSSSSESPTPEKNPLSNDRNELGFSITDVTD